MSVPASKRKTSSMAHTDNAEKLASMLFRFSLRLPKRYTWKLGNPLFNHAEEVVYHCRAANKVYVRDDATFNQRRAHLVEAESHLAHVESLLGIIFRTMCDLSEEGSIRRPSDGQYVEFGKLIERQRKLISGCKRRDRMSYNRQSEAGGSGQA